MNSLLVSTAALPVLCQSLLQTGIRLLIQSSFLLLIGIAAGRALRRSGPARELYLYHAALVAVGVCCLLAPGYGGRYPAFYMPMLPSAQSFHAVGPDRPAAIPSAPFSAVAKAVTPPSPDGLRDARGHKVEVRSLPVISSHPGESWQPGAAFTQFLTAQQAPPTSFMGRVYVALVGLWAAVTILLLLWLTLCHAGIRRICRRALPVTDEEVLQRLHRICAEQDVPVLALLVSRDIRSVFLAGVLRPVILLPDLYTSEFERETLWVVLAHEVAHLRAGDGRWTYFTRLLCAFLWMQPLLWYVCRLREQASEETCDLAAVAQGCSPTAYSRCLVTLAERLCPSRWEQVAGSGSVVFRSSLAQRVQRLMSNDGRSSVPVTPRFRVGIGICGAALAVLFSLTVSAAPLQAYTDLQSDAGLDRSVAITAEGVPIGDLLALITRKTSVALSASSDLADYKVVILGPARPLRDVMYDVAALYNGVWHKITEGNSRPRYLLVRDIRTRDYEQKLAGAVDQRILAKLEEQIQALNERPEELARRKSSDPIRVALSDPDSRMATKVLASLNPKQLHQLVSQCWIRVPLHPLSGDLKDELEVLFNGQRVDDFNDMMMKQFHGAAIPNRSFSRDEMEEQEVSINIHNMSGQPGHATDLSIDMSIPTGLAEHLGNIHAESQFLVPAHGNPYTGKKIADNAPLPDPADVAKAHGDAWVDCLLSLVENTGVPVVSDYYRSKPVSVPTSIDAATAQPTVQALDTFCRSQGYLWWNRGKALVFRKRDWYTQQLYEVPDRWVLALSRRLKEEKGGLTLADCLAVLDLTTEQLAGLDAVSGWRTDKLEMAGCREMLETLATMHVDKTKPLYHGTIGREVMPRQVAYMPDLTDPAQRTALENFMQARERTKITPKDVTPGDFGFLIHPAEMNTDAAAGIDAMIYSGHGTMTIGYRIALPLTLPDDRRDKTEVTLHS